MKLHEHTIGIGFIVLLGVFFLLCSCAEDKSRNLIAATSEGVPQYTASFDVSTLQATNVLAVVRQVATSNAFYELGVPYGGITVHFCTSRKYSPTSGLHICIVNNHNKSTVVQLSESPSPLPTPRMKQVLGAMETALKNGFGSQNVKMTECVLEFP